MVYKYKNVGSSRLCVKRTLGLNILYTKTKNREKRAEEKNPPTTHTYLILSIGSICQL